MNNVNGKNFRKILGLENNELNAESIRFRKSISLRLSTPVKEEHRVERIPGHDILSFE